MNAKSLVALVIALLVVAAVSFRVGLGVGERAGFPVEPVPGETATLYHCSMHPHITLPHPGQCTLCPMDLVPVKTALDDPGPRALELSAAALELAEVETAPVRREFVESVVSMVGKIEFDETAVRTITARVPGRLERLYVNYTGVPIGIGDHLADIYSPTLYAAQQQLLEALKSTREEGPDAGSGRVRSLSEGTLEAVRKKLRLLGLEETQIADIEQRGTLSDRIQINSTVAGVAVEKLADEGDYVETGSPLYKVVGLERLWVLLDAYESDLPWLRYGQDVSFRTAAYPGEEFQGQVSFIDWVVHHRTRTVKVRVQVDNSDGRLKPGMFVRAEARSTLTDGGRVMSPALEGKWISPMHPEIVKDGPGECDVCGMQLVPAEKLFRVAPDRTRPPLVIPATAPLITGKRAVVYVRRPGEKAIFDGREIVLGPRADAYYVVLSGLEEGELVVTRGNFKIDSALQIIAKPSMMHPRGGGGGGAHQHGGEGHGGHEAAPESVALERLPVSPAIRSVLEGLFAGYLKCGEALVAGELESAESGFAHLGNLLGKIENDGFGEAARESWEDLARRIQNAVVLASTSRELEELRRIFSDLSQAFIELERRFGHVEGTLFEMHCPMALEGEGASWLQGSRDLLNPYYGAAMLNCGTLESTFSPVTREESAAPSPEEEPDHEHE